MPRLLLRSPPTSLAQGIVSHIEDQRDSVDYKKALQQWHAYGDIFRTHGWEISTVDQDDSLPDSVFVEDGIISVDNLQEDKKEKPGLLIFASPGNSAREGEIAGIQAAIKSSLPQHAHAEILKPGKLDGGDILKIPCKQLIYIGNSARTNVEGIRQFTALVQPLGWKVETIPVKKALHLKSMVTALPDGTVIGFQPFLEDHGVFEKFIAMPEAEGVAVVHLNVDPSDSNTPLLISASAPKSYKILEDMGHKLIKAEVSEFEKLEGCVTCLSVRIRHD
ncbi:dimethylarginine dimethylaminohydrolase [Meira miltonrushii]|uniref:Dimethylarginine dimethylaminohydrolase n=1 Tax=Meira miltonrushii TaxID=1280837 RepID=A0A316V2W0_9BASI|nr:dimethylarginine dimethylaminohydrolase [Meira miltonrushii]PWN31594.1 dimethylarginine dimethylaminohydrolase [Meira miltonrushii]